ncbi:Uncharacterised protein [Vibrio cholerae]|nr:Uncharacterised protein [Vibrio cholerae]
MFKHFSFCQTLLLRILAKLNRDREIVKHLR